jgi:hypothetical protein
VTIGASNVGSSNFLSVGGNRLAFLVYRVIVPDQGVDRSGGVGVPAAALTPPVPRPASIRCLCDPITDLHSRLSASLSLAAEAYRI